MIATCFNFASNITKMQKVYLLSVLKKNGFLVYKCEGSNDMIIRKKSDYANEESFKKMAISFKTADEAEAFIKENKLAGIEVTELEG